MSTLLSGKTNPRDAIGDLLHGLSALEEKTGLVFSNLSEKTYVSSVKPQLLEVSIDSKRHAAVFEDLSRRIGLSKMRPKDCEKQLGSIAKTIEQVSSEISKKEKITAEELYELISILEGSSVEEQFIQIQTKTLDLMASTINNLYSVNFEEFEEIFRSTSRDEEKHMIILQNIREAIEAEKKMRLDALKIKYQGSDAWAKTRV